jgi:hypothetical protein
MELQAAGTVIAVLTAAIGIPLAAWRPFKERQDWASARSKQMREEFDFADKFMTKLVEGSLDPFSKELGLHTLAGTMHIKAAEIEYVISLRRSPSDLRAYISGRHYLDSDRMIRHRELDYKAKFRGSATRRWRKRGFFFLYMLCFLGACWPLLWPLLSHATVRIEVLLLGSAALIPLALIFAKETIDIGRAEALMQVVEELRAKGDAGATGGEPCT